MDKDAKIQKLLEDGLYHYGLGENSIAIEMWKQVIELDPENEVAREYLSIEIGPDWEQKLNLKPAREKHISVSITSPEKPTRDEFNLGQQHLLANKPERAFSLFLKLVEQEPDNQLYRAYLELSKASFFKLFNKQVGSLNAIPELNISPSKITELNLTEAEGFILSLINGEMSIEDILSVAPLPPFESIFIIGKFYITGAVKSKTQAGK